jgi:hypothetical protein
MKSLCIVICRREYCGMILWAPSNFQVLSTWKIWTLQANDGEDQKARDGQIDYRCIELDGQCRTVYDSNDASPGISKLPSTTMKRLLSNRSSAPVLQLEGTEALYHGIYTVYAYIRKTACRAIASASYRPRFCCGMYGTHLLNVPLYQYAHRNINASEH